MTGLTGAQGRASGQTRIHWPPEPDPSPVYRYALDAEDGSSADTDVRMQAAARLLATARVLELAAGTRLPGSFLQAACDGPGLLILEGLIVRETRVADRTAAELLGGGDLVQPLPESAGEIIEHHDAWRVLQSTRVAVLDGEFAERARPWPQLTVALLRRAGRRISATDALRSIASQPRLEVRLDLLLWHLAGRWGRVEPTGVRLTLPLTHRLLGQLIGAERPSISHALHRLANPGLVTGVSSDLHLNGSIAQHLETLHDRDALRWARWPSPSSFDARSAGSDPIPQRSAI